MAVVCFASCTQDYLPYVFQGMGQAGGKTKLEKKCALKTWDSDVSHRCHTSGIIHHMILPDADFYEQKCPLKLQFHELYNVLSRIRKAMVTKQRLQIFKKNSLQIFRKAALTIASAPEGTSVDKVRGVRQMWQNEMMEEGYGRYWM